MFEPFTQDSKDAIVRAQTCATRLSTGRIGSEELLLGLLAPGTDAIALLTAIGIDPAALQTALETRVHRTDPLPPELEFTPNAKTAIQGAFEAARRMRDSAIGTRHLLLGLVGTEDCGAATVLAEQHATGSAGESVPLSLLSEALLALIANGVHGDEKLPQVTPIPTRRPGFQTAVTTALSLAKDAGKDADSEHLLLALLQDKQGLAGPVLNHLGITDDSIRQAIDDLRKADTDNPEE